MAWFNLTWWSSVGSVKCKMGSWRNTRPPKWIEECLACENLQSHEKHFPFVSSPEARCCSWSHGPPDQSSYQLSSLPLSVGQLSTNPLPSPSTARLLWEYMCIKLACMYKHDQHPAIKDPRSQQVLSGDCSRLKINGQGLQFLFPYKWVSSPTYTGRTNT